MKEHWEKVYSRTDNTKRGWYQKTPVISLDFLALTGAHTDRSIIDVGGGTSHLAQFIDVNSNHLSILDISEQALTELKSELNEKAEKIQFIAGDICKVELPEKYDIWHDRAVFHFLTESSDQQAYAEKLNRHLKSGGWLIIATFALDGPEKCSGLPVQRYSPESLSRTLGSHFHLKKTEKYSHHTPSGNEQKYIYCLFQKE